MRYVRKWRNGVRSKRENAVVSTTSDKQFPLLFLFKELKTQLHKTAFYFFSLAIFLVANKKVGKR